MSEQRTSTEGGWAPPSTAPPVYSSRPWRPDPAGWGARVGATLVDGLIVGVGAFIIGLVVGASAGDSSASGLFTVVWVLATIAYAPLMLAFNNGQTLGKAALNIRVVNADTAPIGLGRAFVREVIAKAVCGIIPLIDVLWPLWQSENKALHDLLAGTWVVEAN
jgi:uncharacterized RDD family membrane protein YckC